MSYAKVIIDISAEAIDRAFTYRIPDELTEMVRPGVRVKVPFGTGNRLRNGYVIELSETVDFDESKVKDIAGLSPKAMKATSDLIEIATFMAREYGSTLNQALVTALPVKREIRKNSRRTDPVKRIEELGYGEKEDEVLNEEQQKAVSEILSETGRPSLLYGITGSGKTRVYIELIRRMQKEGKQTIVLIPEISLTYQTVNELASHLGQRIAVLHSKLTEGERYEQYDRAQKGEIDVMVGARSAIFTPFENLGLIIIDEEHEKAYISDTSPRYDVREVAVRRAELSGAKLLLGSATPSVESYKKALDGEYSLSVMKKRASWGARLPEIIVSDMRDELAQGNKNVFSLKLYSLICDRLEKGEQTMLFLNRRGYAGFVSCRSCGFVVKCPHCDVSLTAHNDWYRDPDTGVRKAALLSCHYCGYTAPMPGRCPECGSKFIAPFGTGTQKLEQAVKRTFPGARVLRMDADSTQAKDAHEKILSEFRNGNADILIGTQMIVKGHDFPNVTLVGIVAADQSINVPDYGAAERTYQLLTQASGRAGRGEKEGAVVIQSYEPSHYAIQMAAGRNYEDFYKREMGFRKLMKYPPEVSLLSVRLQSEDEGLLDEASARAAGLLTEQGKYVGVTVIGPCEAGVYRVNDVYRKVIYLKHEKREILLKLRDTLQEFIRTEYKNRKIFLNYDIK
ncbi:MAG: primosomal protein N' [Lachnospiraceae bacterium]|nr:primosomal protein N' [Lachnospiraceae bacterium]